MAAKHRRRRWHPSAWRARLDARVLAYLHRLGFHNNYRTFIHGPPERVHDYRKGGRRPGVILNTRSGEINLAKGVVLGHNTMLLTGRHEFEEGLLLAGADQVPEEGWDIVIGRGTWIASGAIILGGVTIGENVIVAAGAVVTRDVPDGAVVAGVPARVIATTADRSVVTAERLSPEAPPRERSRGSTAGPGASA